MHQIGGVSQGEVYERYRKIFPDLSSEELNRRVTQEIYLHLRRSGLVPAPHVHQAEPLQGRVECSRKCVLVSVIGIVVIGFAGWVYLSSRV